MKRPFAVIGFTAFSTLFSLFLFDRDSVAYCVMTACVLLAAAAMTRKNLRQAMTVPVCLITAVCACLLFVSFNSERQNMYSLDGTTAEIEGTIIQSPFRKDTDLKHICEIRLENINGEKAKGKLRLYFSPTRDAIDCSSLSAGSKLRFKAQVSASGKNDKSIKRYFTSKGIFLSAYNIEKISISPYEKMTVSYYAEKLRFIANEKLFKSFEDKIAGLLAGILTGEKGHLDAELYNKLCVTGSAHLMAVSGLHLSVWVLSLSSLLPEKKRTNTMRIFSLIFAVIFIMLLAGMSESVKRAGLMSIVFLSSKLSSRQSDSINSLGFAVLLIILINPASVMSVSLQLSFLSTLGILTLGRLYLERSAEIFRKSRLRKPWRKLLKGAVDSYSISISVLVFTFPVLIDTFGGISSVTALVNILIAPVIAPLLLLTGLYAVLPSMLHFVTLPVAFAIKLLSEYIIFITDRFSDFNNAFIEFFAENLGLYFASAGIIVCFSLLFPKKSSEKRKTAAAVCAIISALIIIV